MGKQPKPSPPVSAARAEIATFAASLPLATEDFPWGEMVFKVNAKKIFLFFGAGDGSTLYVGVKLTESLDHALSLPNIERMGYGLGAHGWVSGRWDAATRADDLPVDLIIEWVEESYRNVAPKKLVAELDSQSTREDS